MFRKVKTMYLSLSFSLVTFKELKYLQNFKNQQIKFTTNPFTTLMINNQLLIIIFHYKNLEIQPKWYFCRLLSQKLFYTLGKYLQAQIIQ